MNEQASPENPSCTAASSCCRVMKCMKQNPWRFLGGVVLSGLLVWGIWAGWGYSCRDCDAGFASARAEALQRQLDQLDALVQAHDPEEMTRKQKDFATRLEHLESRVGVSPEKTGNGESVSGPVSLEENLKKDMQAMRARLARQVSDRLCMVRMAMLITAGQPFGALLERLEERLLQDGFPASWLKDMKAGAEQPVASREVLVKKGRWLLKGCSRSGGVCEKPANSSCFSGFWCTLKGWWARVFSVQPVGQGKAWEEKCRACVTLEDLIQEAEAMSPETMPAGEQRTGVEEWLKQANQRIHLDQAAEALWNRIIEDEPQGE